jgi:hypothetical protein
VKISSADDVLLFHQGLLWDVDEDESKVDEIQTNTATSIWTILKQPFKGGSDDDHSQPVPTHA